MSLNHLAPGTATPLAIECKSLQVTNDVVVNGMITAAGGIESSGPLLEINVDGGAADAIGFFAPRDADIPGPDVYCGLVRDGPSWYLLDDSATAPPDADLGALGDLNVKGLTANGLAHVVGDLTVDSNLGVSGASFLDAVTATSTTISAPAAVVNSTALDQPGIGFYAPRTPVAPGPTQYCGLLREAGDDNKWHLVDGTTTAPPGDLLSHGNLEVDTLKARVVVRVEELKVDDPLFEVNAAAVDDTQTVGFYAQQIPAGPTYYTGLVREPTAKKWYLIDNSAFEPPNPGAYGSLGDFSTAEFKSATADASLEVKGTDVTTTGTGTLHVLSDNGLWLQSSGPYITLERSTPADPAVLGITTDSNAQEWGIGARSGDDDFTLYTTGGTVARFTQANAASFTGTINTAGSGAGDLLIGDGAGAMVRLPPGANGTTLQMSAGTAAWVAPGATGFLPLSGGTMSGAIAMGGNSVTGADAFTGNSLDRASAGTLSIGTGGFSSAITLGKAGQAMSVPCSPTFTDLIVADNGIRTPVLDYLGGSLTVGSPNATGVDVSVLGALTTVKGSLQTNQALTVTTTSALQGAVTFGSGGTSYTLPTARGITNQILVENGGGAPAWTSLSTGQVYASAGVLTGATGYGIAWAQSATAANAAEGVATRHIMLRAGTITRMSYSTANGTATSEYAIRLNGADATTFLGTGAAGTAVVAVAVAIGDTVSLWHTGAGVSPDNSILTIVVT
jgi:hypothetical protein